MQSHSQDIQDLDTQTRTAYLQELTELPGWRERVVFFTDLHKGDLHGIYDDIHQEAVSAYEAARPNHQEGQMSSVAMQPFQHVVKAPWCAREDDDSADEQEGDASDQLLEGHWQASDSKPSSQHRLGKWAAVRSRSTSVVSTSSATSQSSIASSSSAASSSSQAQPPLSKEDAKQYGIQIGDDIAKTVFRDKLQAISKLTCSVDMGLNTDNSTRTYRVSCPLRAPKGKNGNENNCSFEGILKVDAGDDGTSQRGKGKGQAGLAKIKTGKVTTLQLVHDGICSNTLRYVLKDEFKQSS